MATTNAARTLSRPARAAFVRRRIARSGCFAGIRASMSTYENNAPLVRSSPRIDPSRFANPQTNRTSSQQFHEIAPAAEALLEGCDISHLFDGGTQSAHAND